MSARPASTVHQDCPPADASTAREHDTRRMRELEKPNVNLLDQIGRGRETEQVINQLRRGHARRACTFGMFDVSGDVARHAWRRQPPSRRAITTDPAGKPNQVGT